MMTTMMAKAPTLLSYSDRLHVLDAIEDALLELEDNELVSQALLDKLVSAREILINGVT